MKQIVLSSFLFLCIGGSAMAQSKQAVKSPQTHSTKKVSSLTEARLEKTRKLEKQLEDERLALSNANIDQTVEVDPRYLETKKYKSSATPLN